MKKNPNLLNKQTASLCIYHIELVLGTTNIEIPLPGTPKFMAKISLALPYREALNLLG